MCLFGFINALPVLKDFLHAVVNVSLTLLTMSSMFSVLAILEDWYLSRSLLSSSQLGLHFCFAISFVTDSSIFLFSSLVIQSGPKNVYTL